MCHLPGRALALPTLSREKRESDLTIPDLSRPQEPRLLRFSRTQLPFLAMFVVFVIAMALALPRVFNNQLFQTGLVLAGVATAASLFVPWERINNNWLISVAVVDLAAVAFARTAAYPDVTAVGLLAIFPALLLSYRFHAAVTGVAGLGALFITFFPVLLGEAEPPDSALKWVNLLALPVVIIILSAAVRTAVAQLEKSRKQAEIGVSAAMLLQRQAEDGGRISRTVFETINAPMSFFAPDGSLTIANQAARDLTQRLGISFDRPPYVAEHVYGMDRVTPLDGPDQPTPRALRGEQFVDELAWYGPPGDQIAIMGSARSVFRSDGSLLGTIIAGYDITGMADAIDIRDRFLTTVSHELRTPLTSVIGYLEILEDSIDAEELGVAGYLRIAQRNSAELLARIAELLTFSDKGIHVEPELTQLRDLVADAVASVVPSAGRAGLEVKTRLAHNVQATVDPRRFSQVVDNLLSNAIKYTAPGGEVIVSLKEDASRVLLSVMDNGRGMNPEEQRQAFDRFYRAKTVRTDAIQGFGVGLSIVKEIVEAHRGEIIVRSVPGAGTTMTVSLPRIVFDELTEPAPVSDPFAAKG